MKKSNLLKNQLGEMDDDALRGLITMLAASAGVPAEKVTSLTENVPALRKALNKMDDKQITALMSAMGRSEDQNGK